MVTMNGEECHNEWEITFEEIHRNGAIAFAIYNYYRLGVTGPNEYENNVNNNWYTNYLAKWCLNFALEQLEKVKDGYADDYHRIIGYTKLTDAETSKWKRVASNMYFPFSKEKDIYLQQDGFLDKELFTVEDLPSSQRPINQKWSWDRILRSPYIKQADILQGFYLFEDHFTTKELEKHFDFYEPFTVHESSLSPCVHSIQAAKLNRVNLAYTFYLRTSRLDLDDYNKEVEEGLHITSMAGTWMSIVEGFGGMRVINDKLSFTPRIPKEWKSYSFKINFRKRIVQVTVSNDKTSFILEGNEDMSIRVNNERVVLYLLDFLEIQIQPINLGVLLKKMA